MSAAEYQYDVPKISMFSTGTYPQERCDVL